MTLLQHVRLALLVDESVCILLAGVDEARYGLGGSTHGFLQVMWNKGRGELEMKQKREGDEIRRAFWSPHCCCECEAGESRAESGCDPNEFRAVASALRMRVRQLSLMYDQRGGETYRFSQRSRRSCTAKLIEDAIFGCFGERIP